MSQNDISDLKLAMRVNDPIIFRQAMARLRAAGCTNRQCYRFALAGNPDLTHEEFSDMMARADSFDSETGPKTERFPLGYMQGRGAS